MKIEEERLYRKKEVLHISGLTSTTLNRYVERGAFPEPFKTGPRTIAWLGRDLIKWMELLQRANDRKLEERYL